MRLLASIRDARGWAAFACGVSVLGASASAGAADSQPAERQLTPAEIDAWLDSRAMPTAQAGARNDDELEAPPPPPRKKGIVLESSIGVMGQLGNLKHITPNAPWFGLRLGYEPLNWLMVFAESDVAIASTSYAHPPPPPRSFALWDVGAGLRLTLKPADRFGLYLQASIGGGRVTEDVLRVYGYQHAHELGIYESAELGFEWYQINPHLALAVHGGARNYPRVLKRERATSAPLTWLSGVALRYTF